MKTFWFSFLADNGFLGGCLADGVDFEDAHDQTWAHKCNPGGSVQAMECGEDLEVSEFAPFEKWRLYSLVEMQAMGASEKWVGQA
jgi:hypothetical protein